MNFTPVEDIERLHATARKAFKEGKAQPVSYRKYQLAQLAYLVQDNLSAFQSALKTDLGRPILESNFMELSQTIIDAVTAYKNVENWVKPERAPFNINTFAMRPRLTKSPRGTVLIIAPFNYPVSLLLGPLAGAIAAGNAAVLKPSELAPTVSKLIAELVPRYLDPELYQVVLGAIPQSTRLLELRWDAILYTGGPGVGRIVAAAAAKHLTPVTLELGGKSPVIVDDSADFKLAARRILWGRASNAGQTCIAPDYVLVSRHRQEDLLSAFVEVYAEFYPDGPAQSESISRIVSDNHFERIKGLLDKTAGRIIRGGETDARSRFIAPTIIADVRPDDSLMSQEIFGPLIPIMPVENLNQAIEFINSGEHPLALYLFATDNKVKEKVMGSTQSGSMSINETMVQGGVEGFPIGGVGGSGYGATKGKFAFDTFTHIRPVLEGFKLVDLIIGARYPPYSDAKRQKLDGVNLHKVPFERPAAYNPTRPSFWTKWRAMFVFALLSGVALYLKKRSGNLLQ